jgi:hypothetical protein
MLRYSQHLDETKAEFDDKLVVYLKKLQDMCQPNFLNLWQCIDCKDGYDD